MSNTLYPTITDYIHTLDTTSVTAERTVALQALVDFVQQKIQAKELVNLNFICTHNSRRSHMSQVWAQTMASFFNTPKVVCYSGGTEATALFPSAAKALESSGFQIQTLSEGQNPVYAIRYADNLAPIIGFSKTYDDAFNAKHFAAIMTCSHADENCPLIQGAQARLPITYEDPKAFDGTPIALDKYKERSHQIATEMKWIFERI